MRHLGLRRIQLAPAAELLPSCIASPAAAAEIAAAKGEDGISAPQLAREIKAYGRQNVPDDIKAELLQRLRAAILN